MAVVSPQHQIMPRKQECPSSLGRAFGAGFQYSQWLTHQFGHGLADAEANRATVGSGVVGVERDAECAVDRRGDVFRVVFFADWSSSGFVGFAENLSASNTSSGKGGDAGG